MSTEPQIKQIDFTSDVSATRQLYLSIVLSLMLLGVLPAAFVIGQDSSLVHLIPPAIGCLATLFLHGWQRHVPAAWAILIGQQAMFVTWLYINDSSRSSVYFMALLPIIIAGLLLDNRQEIIFNVLSIASLLIVAIFNEPHPSIMTLTIIIAIAVTHLIARDAQSNAFRELTKWALEAQRKSEHRSQMYYAQRQQLQEALHDLTMANFQLEEMNIELDRARQQAEQANAVKSMFLASMSHELRTPLNSILNFSQFIINGLMGPTTEKQQESLNYINNSGRHLLSLINDVLDISKIEAGALELFVEEDVDLMEELRTILKTGEGLLDRKPVEIRIETEGEIPLIVGDRQRIFQIVMNLVSNACKFTKEGTITLKAQRKNGSVVVAVQDSGPGIEPGDKDTVFESFRQTKRGFSAGGTGLGLPISKRLAEAHGGQLWFESEPGHGATFFVELPIRSNYLLGLMHEKET